MHLDNSGNIGSIIDPRRTLSVLWVTQAASTVYHEYKLFHILWRIMFLKKYYSGPNFRQVYKGFKEIIIDRTRKDIIDEIYEISDDDI